MEETQASRAASEGFPLSHDIFTLFLIKYRTQYGHKREHLQVFCEFFSLKFKSMAIKESTQERQKSHAK